MKAFRGLALSLLPGISAIAQIAPTEANLRSAVSSGSTITFNADGVIPLTSPLIISNDVTIDAFGNNITIDGGRKTRIFEVASGVHFTIQNLVLANGVAQGAGAVNSYPNGHPALPGYGGAIKASGSVIRALNCTFTQNSAVGGTGYHSGPLFNSPGGDGAGGAIWQTSGSLTIEGCLFVANSSWAGEGSGPQTAFGGAIFTSGTLLQVNGAKFFTNTCHTWAPGPSVSGLGSIAAGGAIHASDSTVTIQESELTDNQRSVFREMPARFISVRIRLQ